MYRSIVEAVIVHSLERPDKLALADATCACTYKKLAAMAGQGAAFLEQRGIEKGDSILVECTQDVRFIILDMACELAGVVFIPLEKKMTPDRVRDMYAESGARLIIGAGDYSEVGLCMSVDEAFELMESIEEKPAVYEEREKVAEILYTTGTTGAPKGIVISNAANIAIAENISQGVEMKVDTVELVPLPLSHSHGLRTCYANLLNGSAVVIVDGVMNVGLFFKMIEQYGVNAIDISPTLAKILLKLAKKGLEKLWDTIDYIEIGTAVLEDDTKNKLKDIFKNSRLYNFYGSTEAGRSCVLDFNKTDDTGCIGYPSKHAVFYFVDDERREIQSSRENPGLLAMSGEMMMEGYYNSEKLTKETLVNGILYTNDLGYQDEQGKIYVLGRQDDIINYKGIKIAPEEIETVACRYKGVTDCAVIPLQDAMCGQVPKLVITVASKEAYDEKAYMEYLKENLEQSRVPAVIEIIDKMPRSSNGKLKRKSLR